MIRLTIRLNDGRTLSGVYHWLGALARLDYAQALPTFKDFEMGPA